jgi:tetratricopeptide (TPR) repeat protein
MKSLDHNQYNAAIADFTVALKKRKSSDRYFLLGYAYYRRGFQSGTPETADKADAVRVIENYKMAMTLDPKLSEVSKPYMVFHGMGMAYEAIGLDDKALVSYRDAFLVAPTNLALPLYGARLRLKMGATKKSAANLTLALKQARQAGQDAQVAAFLKNPMFAGLVKSPENAQIIAQYSQPAEQSIGKDLVAMEPMIPSGDGYELRDAVRGTGPSTSLAPPAGEDQAVLDAVASANDDFKFRKWSRAAEGYNKALTVNQQSRTLGSAQVAFIQERLGAAYNKLGRTTLAIIALKRSVQAMHYNCDAHYQLALSYTISGHYKDGLKELQDALATAPSPAERRKFVLMAKTDSELDPLRDKPDFRAAIENYVDRAPVR